MMLLSKGREEERANRVEQARAPKLVEIIVNNNVRTQTLIQHFVLLLLSLLQLMRYEATTQMLACCLSLPPRKTL